MDLYELLGYLGSFVLLVAIMIKNVKKFRWVNSLGCLLFTAYGLLIGAYPVAIMNGAIILVNLFYLYQMYTQKDYFEINEELKGTEFFVNRFLDFYKAEIDLYFPDFDLSKINGPKLIFVSRNMNPVGLFVYEKDEGSKSIIIHMDFACPNYRDMKNFFYILRSKIEDFKSEGYIRYVTQSNNMHHIEYLERVGFRRSISGDRFELPL